MKLFEFFAVLAAVTVSLEATVNTMPGTPPGFQPATTIPLVVLFINGIDATGGKQVGKDVAKQPPVLASAQRFPGTSYAAMMVDLDVPTSSPPQTTTLLHWMQSGLTQSRTQTTFNTTLDTQKLYTFDIPGAVQAAAPYIGPAPPARTPLNHRYTLIVVDTSGVDPNNMNILMKAAQSRIGFNTLQVLTQANLLNKVVAGDYFRVTSPGPAKDRCKPPQAPAPAPAPVQPPKAVPPAPIIPASISPPPPVATSSFPTPSTIPATVPLGGGFGSGSTPSSPSTFGTTPSKSWGTTHKSTGVLLAFTLVVFILTSL